MTASPISIPPDTQACRPLEPRSYRAAAARASATSAAAVSVDLGRRNANLFAVGLFEDDLLLAARGEQSRKYFALRRFDEVRDELRLDRFRRLQNVFGGALLYRAFCQSLSARGRGPGRRHRSCGSFCTARRPFRGAVRRPRSALPGMARISAARMSVPSRLTRCSSGMNRSNRSRTAGSVCRAALNCRVAPFAGDATFSIALASSSPPLGEDSRRARALRTRTHPPARPAIRGHGFFLPKPPSRVNCRIGAAAGREAIQSRIRRVPCGSTICEPNCGIRPCPQLAHSVVEAPSRTDRPGRRSGRRGCQTCLAWDANRAGSCVPAAG